MRGGICVLKAIEGGSKEGERDVGGCRSVSLTENVWANGAVAEVGGVDDAEDGDKNVYARTPTAGDERASDLEEDGDPWAKT